MTKEEMMRPCILPDIFQVGENLCQFTLQGVRRVGNA
jgi:hypothetical protein